MTKPRLFIVTAAVLAIVAAIVIQNSFAQNRPSVSAGVTKVAVCDIVEVFNNYERAKDLTSKLNERTKGIEGENQTRLKSLEAIKMELEGLNPGSPEHDQRLNELQRLSIERDAWLKFQETLARREHVRFTQQMYEEILGTIGEISREKGIQIVLYREKDFQQAANTAELLQQIQLRKVLYSDQSIDITETVLERLNLAYRKTAE